MKIKKAERLSHVVETQLPDDDLHAVEVFIREKERV